MTRDDSDYCPRSYTEQHLLRRTADIYVCAFCGRCEHASSGRIIVRSRPYRT